VTPPRGPRRRLLPAVVALAVPLLWHTAHRPVPLGADADHYTALSVARHLARGDGYLNGIVYPVSLSFPFAARVPQPLLERPWAVPLLALPPVALSRGDPAAAVLWSQRLWPWWLGLLAAAGVALLRRRGRRAAPWIWTGGLLVSPLLAMTAHWCQLELPAALLLLLLWRRTAGGAEPQAERIAATDGERRRGAVDGLLWAGLTGLRGELFWLPPLWIAAAAPHGRRGRRLLAAAAVWLALSAPWAARNWRVAGSPWFTLQAWTEHLKETPAHPGYTIYTQPRGEPLSTTLRKRPALVGRKAAAGGKYYLRRAGRWLEPALWIWLVLAAVWPGPGRRRLRLLLLSAGLLAALYAPFSHTLRYMALLLPVLLLEAWDGIEAAALAVAAGGKTGRRARRWALAAVAAAGLLLTGGVPPRLAGWEHAAAAARRDAARLPAAVAAARAARPGPLFSDTAAVLWWSGREGVWWPGPQPPAPWLARAVPSLAGAPWIRLGGTSVDQSQDQSAQNADRQRQHDQQQR